MFDKLKRWWSCHEHEIAILMTIIAAFELFVSISAICGIISEIKLLHDIEVLLTAHGVDWALYTPIP